MLFEFNCFRISIHECPGALTLRLTPAQLGAMKIIYGWQSNLIQPTQKADTHRVWAFVACF